MESKSNYSHLPFGDEFRQLAVEGKFDGKVVHNMCFCHKIGPYPEQVKRSTGLGQTAVVVEMRRVPCSTQCLRASVVEQTNPDGSVSVLWRQDCEANTLFIPLTNLPEAAENTNIPVNAE